MGAANVKLDLEILTEFLLRHGNFKFPTLQATAALAEKMHDNGLEHSEQTVREPQASPEEMPLRSRAQTG